MNKEQIINLFLRGATIGLRFLLIIYITKYFEVASLGEYSLLNTTITLVVILAGLDIYVYLTPKISNNQDVINILKNQMLFFCILYLVLFLLCIISGFFNQIFWGIEFYLIFILIFLEHMALEAYRFFSSYQMPVMANIIQFLKSGFWIIMFLILYEVIGLSKESNFLRYIVLLWISGSCAALLLSIFVINKKVGKKNPFYWDKDFFQKGILISLGFLSASIGQKVIEFSDRFLIEYFLSSQHLGIYSFYFQFSNLISVLIYTAVIINHYPKIFIYHRNKDWENYNAIIKKLHKHILYGFILLFFLSGAGLVLTIEVLDKSLLKGYYLLHPLIGISVLIFNLQQVKRNELVAYNSVKFITYISFFGAIINLISNLVLINHIGIYSAAISSFLAAIFMFISSTINVRKSQLNYF